MIDPAMVPEIPRIVKDFHTLYYNHFEQTWEQTFWQGHQVLKCPLDLWIYQEIMWEVRPDTIIETGTAHGGSALFFASMFDLIGSGKVITVDNVGRSHFPDRPVHPRISYILGSSIDRPTINEVLAQVTGKTMVVLDSSHKTAHVVAELLTWAPHVSVGSYLIVEDGNINGNPVCPEHGPGPTEAIAQWKDDRFEVDKSREKFYLTFNPGGYFRRVR